MSEVFVLRNQLDQFLTKQKEWISEGDSKTLFRSELKDELVNEKVELTVKNPDLRLHIVAAERQSNGRIFVDGDDCIPKARARELMQDDMALDTQNHEGEMVSFAHPDAEL